MDDLDRLYNRLVENIRSSYPEYMSRPFEVSELYQTLVPYRHNRRELQIDTNGDYEIALLRLLSGERGYLQGEPAMHDMIKRELATPNPNSAIFREFAARQVTLGDETPRASAPPETRPQPTREQRPSREQPAHVPYASDVASPYEAPPRIESPPIRDYAFGSSLGSQTPAAPAMAAPAPPAVPPGMSSAAPPPTSQSPVAHTAAASAPRAAAPTGVMGGECRYCGGALPTGRRTVYCPHCGQNLTIQRCPACGTELEMGWKHCITCGRGVSGS